ncbi:hypothetical protein BDR03DRAFT_984637 [Suillus americanus]|nr:hypothetical protein BDR03DRAFT_984637 [Suillus americanus]
MGGTPPQGQACANIYDSALSMRDENQLQDAGWQFGFKLKNKHIWDAFIILTLTKDCDWHGVLLDVPNDGAQTHRFPTAMQAHNEHIVYEGQQELRHYCDTCMRTYWNDDGLDNVCAVVDCDMPVLLGRKACALPAHRGMECLHGKKMRANFQATKRLQKMHAAQPNDVMVAQQLSDALDLEFKDKWYTLDLTTQAMKLFTINNPSSTGELDGMAVQSQEGCDGKSELGNCKLRAKFGRSQTHNEQIVIHPCGIIVARATMVAAEAISNVFHMVKTTFSLPGAQEPEHIMYDNNCNTLCEVQSRNDTWFDNIGITKRVICSARPDAIQHIIQSFLMPMAREQANVWLGGYHNIMCEMLPDKYDFFLDEMVMRCNCALIKAMEDHGQFPWYSPADA